MCVSKQWVKVICVEVLCRHRKARNTRQNIQMLNSLSEQTVNLNLELHVLRTSNANCIFKCCQVEHNKWIVAGNHFACFYLHCQLIFMHFIAPIGTNLHVNVYFDNHFFRSTFPDNHFPSEKKLNPNGWISDKFNFLRNNIPPAI